MLVLLFNEAGSLDVIEQRFNCHFDHFVFNRRSFDTICSLSEETEKFYTSQDVCFSGIDFIKRLI